MLIYFLRNCETMEMMSLLLLSPAEERLILGNAGTYYEHCEVLVINKFRSESRLTFAVGLLGPESCQSPVLGERYGPE